MQIKPDIDKIKNNITEIESIGKKLGEGGFKIVYETSIKGEAEALKIVYIPDDPMDPTVKEENISRLKREIKLLQKCKTPFLVKLGTLHPVETKIDDEEYIVYSEEILAGDSMREKIKNGYKPTITELAKLGICALEVISELWNEEEAVHRDIKPDNIMVSGNENRPYVMLDLGVAFIVGGTPLTRDPRSAPGTLYYLAPEMLLPGFRESMDYRADLYTLALTIYEYAVGKNPFMRRGDPEYTTLHRINSYTPEPLETIRTDLPKEFCEVINQLLKKKPALRPNLRKVKKLMEKYQ